MTALCVDCKKEKANFSNHYGVPLCFECRHLRIIKESGRKCTCYICKPRGKK